MSRFNFETIVTLAFVYNILFALIPCYSKNCDKSYQCALATSLSETSSYIYCRGDNSCRQSETIQTTSTGDIVCSGAFACYKSRKIQTTSSRYHNALACRGLYSCALVKNIYIADGHVYCYGELSCFGSTITFRETSDYLYCSGDRSCAEATVNVLSDIYVYGYLGAQNAVFYSRAPSVRYYFYGTSSGDNAEIVCQSGQTCSVYCHGNACNNLKLTCNRCSSIRLECYGESSGVCDQDLMINLSDPKIYIGINEASPYHDKLPDISNVVMSSYDNSYDACFTRATNAINCGDYEDADCQNAGLDTTKNPAPICCTGQRSCVSSHIVSSIPSNHKFIGSTAVRCDGMFICKTLCINYKKAVFATNYEFAYNFDLRQS